eukprot:TRINITY_DN2852_c3_g2::TRINITY_DN2852_c3_g2_i1::g.6270::m.6270 TRINITY_DN2852_c3_g2::TRINITY_DN2852_c3_g2_i1::g.6270  ORF type:complete len:103 (-),score=-7.29,Baculo_FP/PF03258.9/0.039 TRINITY_DN2852_c3_g2_i1:2227-2535(-)
MVLVEEACSWKESFLSLSDMSVSWMKAGVMTRKNEVSSDVIVVAEANAMSGISQMLETSTARLRLVLGKESFRFSSTVTTRMDRVKSRSHWIAGETLTELKA